jgi:hypothetical protein
LKCRTGLSEDKPAKRERKNDKRVSLHPRSFEEALKEAWEAEPPKPKEANSAKRRDLVRGQ